MSWTRVSAGQTIRRILVGAVVMGVLLVPMASAGTDQARAASGVSVYTITSVPAVDAGAQLLVERVVIEPGVLLENHNYPGSATVVVVSGTLHTTLVHGGAVVSRGESDEDADIGATMNLSAGQVISYSPGAVVTVANLRHERLVLIVSTLADMGEAVGAIS